MIKVFQYQKKKICCRITGNGSPVMLVHGFGEDSAVWRNQIEAPSEFHSQPSLASVAPQGGEPASAQSQLTQNFLLNEKFKFIIPDLPGSGQSEMIDDMSMEGMAEVLHAIIHEENIDRCTVIGHSMGGYITLALAEKYGNHLNGFGLFHSSSFADSEEKKTARRKGIEYINQHGAFEFLKATIPNLFSQQTKDERPEIVNEQLATLLRSHDTTTRQNQNTTTNYCARAFYHGKIRCSSTAGRQPATEPPARKFVHSHSSAFGTYGNAGRTSIIQSIFGKIFAEYPNSILTNPINETPFSCHTIFLSFSIGLCCSYNWRRNEIYIRISGCCS
jgi:pimeloyl-ACP methyl ester carboxylesterase